MSRQGKPIQSTKRDNPNYKPATSIRSFHDLPKMSDADKALSEPLRRKLERLLSKTKIIQKQLAAQREEEKPDLSEYSLLKESYEQLDLHNKEYDRVSEALYDVENNPTAIASDEETADTFYSHKTCKNGLQATDVSQSHSQQY